jgi:hypothetical protein
MYLSFCYHRMTGDGVHFTQQANQWQTTPFKLELVFPLLVEDQLSLVLVRTLDRVPYSPWVVRLPMSNDGKSGALIES